MAGRLFLGERSPKLLVSIPEEAALFGNSSEQKSSCLGQLNSACVTDEHARIELYEAIIESWSCSQKIPVQCVNIMSLDQLLKIVQIFSYITGAFAAVCAFLVYRNNSRRERAKWVENLYSRFFERDELKKVRDTLDCPANDARVVALVDAERAKWTDYLNFFELVAYLQQSKQIEGADVKALFQYYLGCLKRHSTVLEYVRDQSKGFKYLRKLLQQLS